MDWYKVLEQIPGLKYQPGDKIPLYKDINGGFDLSCLENYTNSGTLR